MLINIDNKLFCVKTPNAIVHLVYLHITYLIGKSGLKDFRSWNFFFLYSSLWPQNIWSMTYSVCNVHTWILVMRSMLDQIRVIAKDVKGCTYCCYVRCMTIKVRSGGMPCISLPCTVSISRQNSCNQRVCCLLCSMVRINDL